MCLYTQLKTNCRQKLFLQKAAENSAVFFKLCMHTAQLLCHSTLTIHSKSNRRAQLLSSYVRVNSIHVSTRDTHDVFHIICR